VEYKVAFGFLLLLSLEDLRTQRLSLVVIAAFAISGMTIAVYRNGAHMLPWLLDLSVGAGLELIRKVSGGSVGAGDGLTLGAAGLVLGAEKNMLVFAGGMMICAFAAGPVWLIRPNGKQTLPMAPFFLLAEVLLWSLRW